MLEKLLLHFKAAKTDGFTSAFRMGLLVDLQGKSVDKTEVDMTPDDSIDND